MNPFVFYLSGGAQARVIRKTEGRKKSRRVFFIRLRRSRTLISYEVVIGTEAPVYCTIYRDREKGYWASGGKLGRVKVNEQEDSVFEEIKKRIDDYELLAGPKGYLDIDTYPVTPGGSTLFVTPRGALKNYYRKTGPYR